MAGQIVSGMLKPYSISKDECMYIQIVRAYFKILIGTSYANLRCLKVNYQKNVREIMLHWVLTIVVIQMTYTIIYIIRSFAYRVAADWTGNCSLCPHTTVLSLCL